MDYEKKYKEALERAKSYKEHDVRCALEEIFPELKESEDEKIRKEIISHLQYLGNYCQESMPNVNEWIAWLEKQGEKCATDHYGPEVDSYYIPDGYYAEIVGNRVLVKKKPADCFKPIEESKFVIKNKEWSEEDERMYRGLYNLIYSTPYCDSRKELSDWFESIKDRCTWKPSAELMNNLSQAANGASYHTDLLLQLYIQLKQL